MTEVEYLEYIKTIPTKLEDLYEWLGDTNMVVNHAETYLIVENIKYPHLTLFIKPGADREAVSEILDRYSDEGYLVFKNPKQFRSIKLDHWHIVKDIPEWLELYKLKVENATIQR